jgi:alkanesulfonate monooxygenase SsuD/methylene tetrahydromethanopterin reductase-like flavin-dependent oxidoreductase (luciferase family)
MPTLGATFTPDQPPERLGAVAAAAEAAGLEQLWVWEDCFKESGIATATAILATTSRVTVAIGLLPVPLRNVALTAMEIATVARLFPGRLTVGVGHGVLDWMGQVGARVESPMTLLREYTTALRALLHGQTVTAHGRYVHLDDVALDWPPAVVPPLLVGGIRPRTVSLAGELADGVIIPGGNSPDDIRVAVGHFRDGRAARTADGGGEVAVFVSVPADGPAADIAATIGEYVRAGATCIAVDTGEDGADLAPFVRFLAGEVRPLLSPSLGAGGQAPQQPVDQAGGEFAVKRSGVLLVRHDGSGQREHGDLDVGLGPQLTGLDAAADDRPHGVAAGLDHGLLVPGHQPRVLVSLAEQQRIASRLPRVGLVRAHHLDHGEQVVANAHAGRLGERRLQRAERGEQQLFLVRPAAVDGRLADPGPGGDGLDAYPVEALLGEQVERGLDDRALGLLATRPAGPAAGFGRRPGFRLSAGPLIEDHGLHVRSSLSISGVEHVLFHYGQLGLVRVPRDLGRRLGLAGHPAQDHEPAGQREDRRDQRGDVHRVHERVVRGPQQRPSGAAELLGHRLRGGDRGGRR